MVPYMPNIATVSYTSNMPQHDIGSRILGLYHIPQIVGGYIVGLYRIPQIYLKMILLKV